MNVQVAQCSATLTNPLESLWLKACYLSEILVVRIVLLRSLQDPLFNFVVESKERYRRFKISCHQAVNFRKQPGRHIFSKALGYSSIFSARVQHIDADTGSLRLQKKKRRTESPTP